MPLINRNFINIIVFIALLLTGVVFTYQNYIELRVIAESMKIENVNKSKINIADITGDASILPFQMSEMGNGLAGAMYSFIEEDKNDLMNQNYSFLQDRDINKMPDFTRSDAGPSGGDGGKSVAASKKTGGNTDSAYEQMMKARGSETQQKSVPQTPNFSSPY